MSNSLEEATSANGPISTAISRRALIGGGAGTSALGFEAIAPSTTDEVVVSPGYVAQVIIPWGDPINPDGPAFKFDGSNTTAEQVEQFGQGPDGMSFFERGRNRGLIAVNHEFLDSYVSLHPTAPDYTQPETVLKSQNALGVSIAELELRRGNWNVVRSNKARRITADTPMELAGRPPDIRSCRRRPIRRVARSSARSTTAPTGSRRGAPTSPARRTSTATSARRTAASFPRT